MPWQLLDRWLAPAPDEARIGWLGGHRYAHRGLHGGTCVENSPGAFAAAIAAGMGIECDVQKSHDGRALVFHDAQLDRLTGAAGPVAARSIGELTKIALSGSGECIPTLRDLLTQVGGKVPLLIEIKTRRNRPVSPLCKAVRRDLEGYRGLHAIMSFDPRVGRWFEQEAPGVTRGLIVTEENRRTLSGAVKRHLALWQARPDFLAYDIRDLPSRFAATQRARGLPLLTWTVCSPELRERAASYANAPIMEGEGVA